MNIPIISIIVPNFNSKGNLLEKCFEPFTSCNDSRIEIIVIDDGSSVSHYSTLVDCYSKITIRKSIIKITNHGQNYARSIGISSAIGKYICFLDSDDYLNWNDFVSLIDYAENSNSDVIGYNCITLNENGQRIGGYGFGDLASCEQRRIKRLMLSRCAELWLQLVKRELFTSFPLYYGSKIGEDFASIFPIIAEAKSVSCCNLQPYCYVEHSGSMMHSSKAPTYAGIVNSFKHVIACYPNVFVSFHDEFEWQAIHHILHYNVWRILRIGRLSRYAFLIRKWVVQEFPNWKGNPYYIEERKNQDLVFKLIVDGHFLSYLIFRKINALFRR